MAKIASLNRKWPKSLNRKWPPVLRSKLVSSVSLTVMEKKFDVPDAVDSALTVERFTAAPPAAAVKCTATAVRFATPAAKSNGVPVVGRKMGHKYQPSKVTVATPTRFTAPTAVKFTVAPTAVKFVGPKSDSGAGVAGQKPGSAPVPQYRKASTPMQAVERFTVPGGKVVDRGG